jgi:mannosyltransferase OCH1-like enzyme
MWKNKEIPPPETVHWQQGCKAVNTDMKVVEYNDDDLLQFVTTHYTEYLPLFSKLRGVHMADMARVLVTYHYGGLYMDLDFYCVRPFKCLSQFIPTDVSPDDHILVVPLETYMHSSIFREKERVIIQDFFYATPKHPFFKFLLDDRMSKYNADPEHPAKGPFGYHIEEDIDSFWKAKERSPEGPKKTVIFELRDDVLHALGDATHSRLNAVCYSSNIPTIAEVSCEHVRKGQYFQVSH